MSISKIRDFLGKFQFINIFHYSAMACYYPFIVAFLTKRDYSSTQIGLILTINSIIAIIFQPLWGIICDKVRSVRKVYIAIAIIVSCTVPFITVIHNFYFHLIYIPFCIILFYCSFNTMLDAWIVQGVKSLPGKTYGSIRLWGSAGYMVIVSIMGLVSDAFGVQTIFYFFTFFMLINAIIAFSIREEGVPEIKPIEEGEKPKKPFKELIKNYQYVSFIICMFVLHLPLTLKNGFYTQRLYLAGGNDTIFGFCQSAGAFVEIPIFLLTSKLLNKFKAQHLLIFSMLCYLTNYLIISFPIPPWSFILCNCINGMGYGVFMVASLVYIDSLSPPEFKTSALTIATGIYGGASGIIGNFLSGYIIDAIGIIKSFFFGTAFVAFAIVFFIVLLAIGNKKQNNDSATLGETL